MMSGRVEEIRGKTIRWTWTEGPTKGVTHEHQFRADGTVAWRVLDGVQKGQGAEEAEYAALEVADGVFAVSYLASSGYTLTVVLNFRNQKMVGFASGAKEWYVGKGEFQIVG